MTEPKPVVLPLHHRPIATFAPAKVGKIWHSAKFFRYELLHNKQIVVLLALLSQQILAVDKVFSRYNAVLVGQLFLVQANATTLHHLAHFTFRGEDRGSSGQ